MLSTLTDNPSTPLHHAATDRLLPIREVQQLCAIGKTAIYAGLLDRSFPVPVKIGRSSRWLQSEIQQFIADRAAARAVVVAEK